MGSKPKNGPWKNFPQVFTKFFLRFFKKLPERACCQREPAARESLLPERVCCQRARECQDVPKSARDRMRVPQSAKKLQQKARESQDGPPRIFLRFFLNFFLRFFKKTARECQREPQDRCQREPGRATECQKVPQSARKSSRVPERARGHRWEPNPPRMLPKFWTLNLRGGNQREEEIIVFEYIAILSLYAGPDNRISPLSLS